MNDAIALLAISQLVCLGAIFYLYTQVQSLRSGSTTQRRRQPARVHQMTEPTELAGAATARAARQAYGAAAPVPANNPARAMLRAESGNIAQRVSEYGVDVSELARRMRKSEEEVRLLLRRQGIAS